ncbi:MAG: ribonuclease P protein component [bacterium]|nr:ribonuclease P protein component [bacterium]
MKRFHSIKKNSDFQKVYNHKRSYGNKYLVMYILPSEADTRIGISVSKKVGNSVVRHRLTRLVREVFRLNKDRLNQTLDIVVVVRATAKDKGFQEIESAFLHLCGKHNIISLHASGGTFTA